MPVTNETITIRGTIAFPNLERKDEMADKYTVQLCNLSDKAVERLEELGVSVNYRDDDKYGRGHYILCKSGFPIIPKDVEGNSFEGMTHTIGYGTVVRAVISPYEWKYRGKSGVSPNIKTMIVDELVAPEEASPVELDDAL